MKNTRWLFIVALLLAAPVLFAQRTAGTGISGGTRMGGAVAQGGAGFGHGFGIPPLRPSVIGGFHHHGFHNNRFFSPFWSNAFWWDDGLYPNQEEVVVQPPVTPATPPASRPIEEVKPANPLLIELQGDRFVRLSGNPPLTTSASQPVPHAELQPALLIFRDGRRQEVSSYAIIGPALYASGSYWTTGYWTQKILLADLDLPATIQANQQRGINFVLPAAPNQVVTRP